MCLCPGFGGSNFLPGNSGRDEDLLRHRLQRVRDALHEVEHVPAVQVNLNDWASNA